MAGVLTAQYGKCNEAAITPTSGGGANSGNTMTAIATAMCIVRAVFIPDTIASNTGMAGSPLQTVKALATLATGRSARCETPLM